MKISRDDFSWHASGILARDARHEKTEKQVPGHRAKKDTKRWCRGKVGREHEGEWKGYDEVNNTTPSNASRHRNLRYLVCKRCQRHIDYCCSWFGTRCKNAKHEHYAP